MQGMEAVLWEARRRFEAGESLAGIVSEGYAVNGAPVPLVDVSGHSADERAEALRKAARIHWRDSFEIQGANALVSGVWEHTAGVGQGSAGEFWAVVTVREQMIVAVNYFHDEAAARGYLAVADTAG